MNMASSINTEVLPTFVKDDLQSVENIIGCGGMGVVSLYKWRISCPNQGIMHDQKVAVKKLENASNIRSIKEEAKILWRIQGKCDHILHFYGLIRSSTSICLILDYMKHGNMSNFFQKIKHFPNFELSIWPLKCQIALQICTGMNFLHHWKPKPILHCDLKAVNVLLDDRLNVKICDFGLSKVKATTKPRSFNKGRYYPAGTLSHLAPELFGGKVTQNTKSDVYSFGILLWELTSDRIPYEEVIHETIEYQVVRENYRPSVEALPNSSPRIFIDVMRQAWHKDPAIRPDFSDLCRRFKFDASRRAENDRENSLSESVNFALQAWEQGFGSETVPKHIAQYNDVRRRSANLALLPDARSPSLTTERTRVSQDMNQPVSDLAEDDICVSESTESSVLIDLRDSEIGQPRKDDLRPLMAQPPNPVVRNQIAENRKWGKACVKVLVSMLIVFSLIACGGGIALGRYLIPLVNRGCCVQCFDGTDTGLQRKCGPTNVGGKSIAPPGTACKFSCDAGSVLSGNVSVLTCGHDGIWSGPMPFCRKIRQCSSLSNPANGGSFKCTDEYFENSQCSFTCPDNFRLRLPGGNSDPDSFDITCNEDDLLNFNWSGNEPYCEKIASCPPLTSDPNVKLNCVPPGSTTSYDTTKDQTYTNGTVCKFSCSAPVSLPTNENTALCQDDSTWNTTTPSIKCIENCPIFEDPLHGSHTCTLDRKYSSRCTFTCNENFVMVGTGNMVCNAAGPSLGKWTSNPPKCECPGCQSGDQCQNTLLFQDTWSQLNSTSKMATVFDGREIACSDKPLTDTDNFNYGCQCRDKKTNMIKQCNDDVTQSASCYKAYSSIILMLAYNGTVSLPCDASSMPVPGICK